MLHTLFETLHRVALLPAKKGVDQTSRNPLAPIPLHIAFDAKRYFQNTSGLGTYSRQIIDHWNTVFPDDRVILCSPQPSPLGRSPSQVVQTHPSLIWKTFPFGKGVWRSFAALKHSEKLGAQIYHGLSNELPRSGPSHSSQIKAVVTIHDVLFRDFPTQYRWIDRQIYDIKTRSACQRADAIIAVSHATRNRLIEVYRVSPEKIRVIPPAHSPTFCPTPASEDQCASWMAKHSAVRELWQSQTGYLISVGSLVVRKNQLRVLRSWEKLCTSERLPLVFVGQSSSRYGRQIRGEAESRNRKVYFLNDLEEGLVAELIRRATLSLYLSLGEGYGLPVAESLSCGTPVLTSNVSSMPEAAAGLAWLVDPSSEATILAGIKHCLEYGVEMRKHIKAQLANHSTVTIKKQLTMIRDLYCDILR